MTQYPPQQPGIVQSPPSNGLGLAGFICSLAGIVLGAMTGVGGLLLPIGLILSLIALGREPRGFAIAGVVIGAIGTCGGAIVLVLFGAALLAALGLAAAAISMTDVEQSEMTTDMMSAAAAIRAYEDENDYPPAKLSLLGLDADTLNDPWGNRYEYLLIEEPPGFDYVSVGADGSLGTEDDVRFSELGETWEAGGLGIQVSDDDDSGRVKIRIGNRTITATGDDESGRVEIDLGDRVIEIVGDDEGGRIDVKPTTGAGATGAGDAESESESPVDPAEAPVEAPPVPEAPPEAAAPAAPADSGSR